MIYAVKRSNNPIFFSDKPKLDPKEDQLGYSSLAKDLALSIQRMIPTEGISIGVNGKWGSGKTSLLEFVVYYLENSEVMDNVKIIRFNP